MIYNVITILCCFYIQLYSISNSRILDLNWGIEKNKSKKYWYNISKIIGMIELTHARMSDYRQFASTCVLSSFYTVTFFLHTHISF